MGLVRDLHWSEITTILVKLWELRVDTRDAGRYKRLKVFSFNSGRIQKVWIWARSSTELFGFFLTKENVKKTEEGFMISPSNGPVHTGSSCIRTPYKFDEIVFTPVICKLFLHFFFQIFILKSPSWEMIWGDLFWSLHSANFSCIASLRPFLITIMPPNHHYITFSMFLVLVQLYKLFMRNQQVTTPSPLILPVLKSWMCLLVSKVHHN